MSAINPISGATTPIWSPTSAASAGAGRAEGERGFLQIIRGAVDKVNGDQAQTATAIEDLLAGRSQDVLPVVSAVAKSDLSFRLLMGVRNKVIEAYKQTMNMQV